MVKKPEEDAVREFLLPIFLDKRCTSLTPTSAVSTYAMNRVNGLTNGGISIRKSPALHQSFCITRNSSRLQVCKVGSVEPAPKWS